jgi:putative endonuclease
MPGFTYITTNKNKTVLYVGATDNIMRRIFEHKTKVYKNAFTAKYNCDILIYFEEYEDVNDILNQLTVTYRRMLRLIGGLFVN